MVAPPIMCSSTPRTVNSVHGVGSSSWSGVIWPTTPREQRAELVELAEHVHVSSLDGGCEHG